VDDLIVIYNSGRYRMAAEAHCGLVSLWQCE